MKEGANLHEVARDAVDPLRREFPDTLLDLEHRGDGETEWEAAGLLEALAVLARHAFSASPQGDSIWMRTSGGESDVRAEIEWQGAALAEEARARLEAIAAAHDGWFSLEPRGERLRAALRVPRR